MGQGRQPFKRRKRGMHNHLLLTHVYLLLYTYTYSLFF
ncbi:hypothetical protein VP464E531_P0079 [Vibrio phage 464E53-1]|nr:hypothetical protein VP464E531_P0079 [Vibrio phage 464E53-1]